SDYLPPALHQLLTLAGDQAPVASLSADLRPAYDLARMSNLAKPSRRADGSDVLMLLPKGQAMLDMHEATTTTLAVRAGRRRKEPKGPTEEISRRVEEVTRLKEVEKLGWKAIGKRYGKKAEAARKMYERDKARLKDA